MPSARPGKSEIPKPRHLGALRTMLPKREFKSRVTALILVLRVVGGVAHAQQAIWTMVDGTPQTEIDPPDWLHGEGSLLVKGEEWLFHFTDGAATIPIVSSRFEVPAGNKLSVIGEYGDASTYTLLLEVNGPGPKRYFTVYQFDRINGGVEASMYAIELTPLYEDSVLSK